MCQNGLGPNSILPLFYPNTTPTKLVSEYKKTLKILYIPKKCSNFAAQSCAQQRKVVIN